MRTTSKAQAKVWLEEMLKRDHMKTTAHVVIFDRIEDQADSLIRIHQGDKCRIAYRDGYPDEPLVWLEDVAALPIAYAFDIVRQDLNYSGPIELLQN